MKQIDPVHADAVTFGPDAVGIIGIPYDIHSSYMQGPGLAPARIREVMHSGSSNLCAENGIDLEAVSNLYDLGDLELEQEAGAIDQVETAITTMLARELRLLALGGDHAITYPIVKAYAKKYGPLDILHLDAHPDLYDIFQDNPYSNACPFARIMEEGLATRLVQVGIRTFNPHQRRQAQRFGVESIEMKNWQPGLPLDFKGPLYLSVDLDVLDPAFAPGVSHHEPGGLATREVLQLIQQVKGTIVGADIVEFNPRRDKTEITAMTAVKILKEVTVRMLET